MIKGDKIKLIKPMGAFKNVGEICEVTNIAEGGIISFRFGGCHLGCMSYDEFLKYFVKYFEEIEDPIHRKWSNWKEEKIMFYDMNDKETGIILRYRNNGKKIQVRSGTLRAESSCHKEDTFDFEKGFELAAKRLIVKYLDNQVKSIAKGM